MLSKFLVKFLFQMFSKDDIFEKLNLCLTGKLVAFILHFICGERENQNRLENYKLI